MLAHRGAATAQLPVWVVENKAGEQLRITLEDVEHDSAMNSASTPAW